MLYRLKHQLHRLHQRERYALLDQLLKNQQLGSARLLARQQQALSDIIQFAYDNTSYYHEKYARGLTVDSLPILHKSELVQHREEMLARDVDKSGLNIGNTGGSTGTPVSFYYDQHKHELMRAGMCRSYM